MGRIVRIGTMVENVPQAIDLGMTTPGKLLIKNQGANDIRIGYSQADVNATTGVNFMTLDAGTLLVFDAGPGVGFVAQQQQMVFMATGGNSTLEIWVATV
tara:strand:+ start:274 stop:573 length:300 start_codon:yes stop_codon:yes gene_type:complete